MKPCPNRKHVWTVAGEGGTCKRCKKPWAPRGRPRGPTGKMQAGDAAARLAGTLGVQVPPPRAAAPPGAPPAPLAVADPPEAPAPVPPLGGSEGSAAPAQTEADAAKEKAAAEAEAIRLQNLLLWRRVSKRLTTVLDALTDWGLEQLGREDGEADDDDLKDFQKALEAQLTIWFGPRELTPLKQMILSGGFICAEKWATSKKSPPPTKPEDTRNKTPAALPSSDSPVSGAAGAPTPTLRPV